MIMVKSYRGVADFAGCGESRWIGTYEAQHASVVDDLKELRYHLTIMLERERERESNWLLHLSPKLAAK